MEYQSIHNAHGELVRAVDAATNPGFKPIPISIVSVTPHHEGQMVVFDDKRFTKEEVEKRLRVAADFLASQP